jgi:hypothetical protein
MQKNEDLDTLFPAKSKCRYKIPEEFLESETSGQTVTLLR